MPEEDRATDNGHGQHAQKFGKDRACGSGDILSDRQTYTQTHRHTDILITILRNRSRDSASEVKTL